MEAAVLIVNCLAFGILLRIDFERRLTKAIEAKPVAGRKAKERKAIEAAGGNSYG